MPRRSVVFLRRLRRRKRAQARRVNMVRAEPPSMLPTIVPILEVDMGLEDSASDALSAMLALVTTPINGEIEGSFVDAVLELVEVLVELVVVSGKADGNDDSDILELVNEIGTIHMLLGALEYHGGSLDVSEAVDMGSSSIGLDGAAVVGLDVRVGGSETIGVVEVGLDITVPCSLIDSWAVVRDTVADVGLSVGDEKSSTVVAVLLETDPGSVMV
jgi:hypothetical protein